MSGICVMPLYLYWLVRKAQAQPKVTAMTRTDSTTPEQNRLHESDFCGKH